MRHLLDEDLPDGAFSSISQDMLEKMTQNSQDEFSEEISEENSWNCAWRNFGQTLQAAADSTFRKPVDVQKILAKIESLPADPVVDDVYFFPQKESVVPEKKDSRIPARRFLCFSKWLGASALFAGVFLISTIWYFAKNSEKIPPGDISLAWDNSISEEINEMSLALDDLEQPWSSLDMELAMVSTRLDTIFDTFSEDEWEEDYF